MRSSRPTKILIVDDDEDIREALTDILEAEGFEVALAQNGARALEILSADPLFHLILLDLMMPVMNGQEFTAKVRLSPELSRIPRLVMSAGEHSNSHVRSLGAAYFLRKPIELKMLVTEVRKCLRRS